MVAYNAQSLSYRFPYEKVVYISLIRRVCVVWYYSAENISANPNFDTL